MPTSYVYNAPALNTSAQSENEEMLLMTPLQNDPSGNGNTSKSSSSSSSSRTKQEEMTSRDCTAVKKETKATKAGSIRSSHLMPLPEKQERRISMMDEEENYFDAAAAAAAAAACSFSSEDEEDQAVKTLQQEELNDLLLAWYDLMENSDEEIAEYQRSLQEEQGEETPVARQTATPLQVGDMCPQFRFQDQEEDEVHLNEILRKKGPVVLVFYRGKWCPYCNATLMQYQRQLVPKLAAKNATLVAVSPMLVDGTLFLASKRDLQFSVCSDPSNSLAKEFGILTSVNPQSPSFQDKWGNDLPQLHDETTTSTNTSHWDIPTPATYVIGQDGRIVWAHVEDLESAGSRPEPEDIAQAIPAPLPTTLPSVVEVEEEAIEDDGHTKKRHRFRKSLNKAVGATLRPLFRHKSEKKSRNGGGGLLWGSKRNMLDKDNSEGHDAESKQAKFNKRRQDRASVSQSCTSTVGMTSREFMSSQFMMMQPENESAQF